MAHIPHNTLNRLTVTNKSYYFLRLRNFKTIFCTVKQLNLSIDVRNTFELTA